MMLMDPRFHRWRWPLHLGIIQCDKKFHLFGKIIKVFWWLVSIRQTFEPNLANFDAIMAIFLFSKWPNIEKIIKLSGHTGIICVAAPILAYYKDLELFGLVKN